MYMHVQLALFADYVYFLNQRCILDSEKVNWDSHAMEIGAEVELFVFEAIKGGENLNDAQGDIAVDNILVTAGQCIGETCKVLEHCSMLISKYMYMTCVCLSGRSGLFDHETGIRERPDRGVAVVVQLRSVLASADLVRVRLQ